MSLIDFIIWNVDPDVFVIFGRPIRWYGLLFALGFLISQQIMYYIHRKEGKPTEDVDTLTVYMVISTIIGARLGHVLFYEPQRYLQNPADIIKIWEGGLASHGAAIAILVALYIYSRYKINFKGISLKIKKQKRENQSFLQVVDRIVIVVALTGCLIRLGNFMNSEIYGKPTYSDNGVFFSRNLVEVMQVNNDLIDVITIEKDHERPPNEFNYQPIKVNILFSQGNYTQTDLASYLDNAMNNYLGNQPYITDHIYEPLFHDLQYDLNEIDNRIVGRIYTYAIPRHPTQLYESTGYLIVFILLFYLWTRWKEDAPRGRIFGIFLVILWSIRFGLEFLKANQVEFEENIPLNMGQWLSIPLIIAGVILWIRSKNT